MKTDGSRHLKYIIHFGKKWLKKIKFDEVYKLICQCVYTEITTAILSTTSVILKSISPEGGRNLNPSFDFEGLNRMFCVCYTLADLTAVYTAAAAAAAESLLSTEKGRKAHSQSKTMSAHDAQLAPSVSSSGGVFPPGGSVACVRAPTGGRRTTGI